MNGQKVVKVFCHEEKAIEQFDSSTMSCTTAPTRRTPSLTSYAHQRQLGNMQLRSARSSAVRWLSRRSAALPSGVIAAFLQLTKPVQPAHHQISSSSTPSLWRWPVLSVSFN